jgi:hypothetical protein
MAAKLLDDAASSSPLAAEPVCRLDGWWVKRWPHLVLQLALSVGMSPIMFWWGDFTVIGEERIGSVFGMMPGSRALFLSLFPVPT